MSNEMNTNEIISELDRITSLFEQAQAVRDAVDDITDDEENAVVSKHFDILEEFKAEQNKKFSVKKPVVAADCLMLPPPPLTQPNFTKASLIGAISGLAALGALVLVILSNIIYIGGFLTALAPLVFIALTIYWFVKGSGDVSEVLDWQKKEQEYVVEKKQWENAFNKGATKENNERFLNEFKEYDSAFNKLVEEWLKRLEEELELIDREMTEIHEKNLDKLNKLQEEFSKITEELNKVTLIHSDLFGNAYRISSMLKLGRADTLKEAINMALEEERKDMEEAERRNEARQQEAILERQAEDNRMHNEAMEREAREQNFAMRAHNEAMERAARAQAQAMQAQAAAAEAQTRQAQSQARAQADAATRQAKSIQEASRARCLSCVNSSKCSISVKMNSISCGGYRPR